MNAMTPFQFESSSILAAVNSAGEPMFVAKNIADALGYDQTANALKLCKHPCNLDELNKINNLHPATKWIPESDVYRLIMRSNMPNAEPFQDWVTETVIPSIRKTGSYTAPHKKEAPTAISASKEFRALYGIARLIGCDKNAAAISANQAVQKMTGTNVLSLLGQTYLSSENQELVFNVSDLVDGISGVKMNKMLESAGLQTSLAGSWSPTEKGAPFCRIFDTGKKHSDGTLIQHMKWSKAVLNLLSIAEPA
jgi:prophage antirepressor-like protein